MEMTEGIRVGSGGGMYFKYFHSPSVHIDTIPQAGDFIGLL